MAKPSNVLESNPAIQRVESIRSVNKENCFGVTRIKGCIAALVPAICPPHIWRQPEASWMSNFTTDINALTTIRHAVSPMPIGRTPGFLSRVISWQARKGERDFRLTYDVHILLATRARE